MGLAPACGGSPGGLHAELRLRLLQLCHAGAVGVAGGPAHALRQLVPQLPLHALGLQVQLGQLRDGRTGDGRRVTEPIENKAFLNVFIFSALLMCHHPERLS